eukprot:gb/GEZN01010079.1/.p1 GENE.gb/GEZN01010079.1/~~gb/GEZN01010079.1/.p1  ORF type:complete len:244 (+),score=23.65 gb/GEZN01010079.1/:30-734(+)
MLQYKGSQSSSSSPLRHYSIEQARADPVGRVNGLKLLFLLVRGEREDKGCALLDGPEPVYVDQQDSQGKSPLMEAVKLGQVRMMERLLALGADPNAQDNRGNSVLMYAVTHGNSSAVEILMKMGRTDVNLKNKEGKKAVDLVEDAYGAGGGARGYFDSGYVRELLVLGDTLFEEYKYKLGQLVHTLLCLTFSTSRNVANADLLDSNDNLRYSSRPSSPFLCIPSEVVGIIMQYT